MHIKSD